METAASRLVQQVDVTRIEGGTARSTLDSIAVEEPLEIRIQYWFKDLQRTENLALTMRTPGDDRELALGFLFAEGVVRSREDVLETRALGPGDSNELLVSLRASVDVEMWRMARTTLVSSSCGVCGKRSVAALEENLPAMQEDGFAIAAHAVHCLPNLVRERQRGFAQTGGLHAAGLVDKDGKLCALYEDIGRHNALDKLIGASVLRGELPLREHIVFLSSRSSFELVQKAAMAGAPVLATVGSPSSLAIECARRCGLTLIGFVRNGRFNVYAGEWRIHS
jgi:FdhD protein